MAGVTRRALLAGAGACVAVAVGGAGSAVGAGRSTGAVADGAPTRTAAARRFRQPDAVFGIRTLAPLVALTFDDGPDPDYTPEVLDVLDRYDAKATFFVVGVNALAHPDLLAEVVRRGHSVANHTHHHLELQALAESRVRAEVRGGARAVAAAGVGSARWFRPPKGFTSSTVDRVTRQDRWRTAYWTHCVEACPQDTPTREAMRTLAASVTRGSVLLAHDGGRVETGGGQRVDRSRTLEALPHLLGALRADGWDLVDLPTLVRAGRPR